MGESSMGCSRADGRASALAGFAACNRRWGRGRTVNRRARYLAVSVIVWMLFGLGSAHAQRVALLIGNANYQSAPLRNPPADVREMEAALRAVGFRVQTVLNANQNQMKRAVRDFGSLAQGADIAFFYYSGHGTQANGENYLIPVQAAIDKEADYDVEAVLANAILRQITTARPKAAIVVLDACRDNPFSVTTKGVSKGLLRMDAPTATMIAFATAPNTTVSDEGHYARALAAQIKTPGLELFDVFRNTTVEVRRLSGGKQDPRVSEVSITERIYLAGDPRPGTAPGQPPSPAIESIRDCATCPELVVLPAGSFLMGSKPSMGVTYNSEAPVRDVSIGYRLAVGKYEVTRAEFAEFVSASGYSTEAEKGDGCGVWPRKVEYQALLNWRNPGFNQAENHPVVCVSWNDAQAYVKWLNSRTPGKEYRLLSEAEWEYAARGGQGETRYPWGNDQNNQEQCAYANGSDDDEKAVGVGLHRSWVATCQDGFEFTAPGGALRPNGFGLHHMNGNAWEWVQDIWHDDYEGAPRNGRGWLSGGDQSRRVLRGGAWNSSPEDLRSAKRDVSAPGKQNNYTGFRIARTFASRPSPMNAFSR